MAKKKKHKTPEFSSADQRKRRAGDRVLEQIKPPRLPIDWGGKSNRK